MKIKDYLMAVGLAAACSLAVIFLLWLLSLISWALVWAGLVVCTLPFCYKLTQEYHDSRYRDFMVFLIDKLQDLFKDKPKKSDIEW